MFIWTFLNSCLFILGIFFFRSYYRIDKSLRSYDYYRSDLKAGILFSIISGFWLVVPVIGFVSDIYSDVHIYDKDDILAYLLGLLFSFIFIGLIFLYGHRYDISDIFYKIGKYVKRPIAIKKMKQFIFTFSKKRVTKDNALEIALLLIEEMLKYLKTSDAIYYGKALEYIYYIYANNDNKIKEIIEKYNGICLYDDYKPDIGHFVSYGFRSIELSDPSTGAQAGFDYIEDTHYVIDIPATGKKVYLMLKNNEYNI